MPPTVRDLAPPVTDVPAWVAGLTDAQVSAALGAGAATRGTAYAGTPPSRR